VKDDHFARLHRRYHYGCAEQARKLADEAERAGDAGAAEEFRRVAETHRKLVKLCE